jgi:hypothetical protein
VLPDAGRDALEVRLRAGGVHHHVPEPVGQGDEVALRVDHRLLDVGRALLEQAAQEVGLAGAGIALDQEPGGEEFFEVQEGGRAAGRHPHIDPDRHAPPRFRRARVPSTGNAPREARVPGLHRRAVARSACGPVPGGMRHPSETPSCFDAPASGAPQVQAFRRCG